jgi:hypothetical protein
MGQDSDSRAGSGQIPENIATGLQKLFDAHELAHDAKRDVWDFAVEIRDLREVGLSTSEIRWLVCKDFVAHRVELRRPDEAERHFRDAGDLKFCKRSCFALTPAGVTLAAAVWDRFMDGASPGPVLQNSGQNGDEPIECDVPHWIPARHELRVGEKLVKQYKLRSPNQETILNAFQEEGWPFRIDDPLPQSPDVDPKERLHNTIRALNRHQRHRLIQFRGDGTGEGVMWDLLENEDAP